jgi:hypothetical protein
MMKGLTLFKCYNEEEGNTAIKKSSSSTMGEVEEERIETFDPSSPTNKAQVDRT